MDDIIYIYKITNPKGNIYIGKTKNIKNRIRQYEKYFEKITQPKIQYSINKYGWDNHNFEILEECIELNSNDKERYWISHFDSYHYDNKHGLNLTKGGDGGKGSRKIFTNVKKVEQREYPSGRLVKLWSGGTMEICRHYGWNTQSIYNCLNNNQIKSRGFVWSYVGEFNGVRENKVYSKEHSIKTSRRIKEKYLNGYVNLNKGKTGIGGCKKIYCVELNMEFESISSAAIFFKTNIYKSRKLKSINEVIRRNANGVRKKIQKYNFILL